jgi:hypothetical protein
MKTNPDFKREAPLLDAVLCGDDWRIASVAIKAEVMGAFRRRQRVRRITRCTGWAIALAAGIAGMFHWLGRPAAAPQRILVQQTEQKSGGARFLSDDELLASFPKGSCFLAEIDGRKELVFVDPNVERRFMAKSE